MSVDVQEYNTFAEREDIELSEVRKYLPFSLKTVSSETLLSLKHYATETLCSREGVSVDLKNTG